MTPQEEQAAMQAYVRQRLAAQGQQQQLNLDAGQVPLAPEDQGQFMRRPPLAPEVEPPPGVEPAMPLRDPRTFPDSPAQDMTRRGQTGVYQRIAPDDVGTGEGPPSFLGASPVTVQGGIAPRRLRDARGLLNSQFTLPRVTVPFSQP